MHYHFKHRLRFIYASPATLEAQTLRLRPREDGSQRVFTHHLAVKPDPSMLSRALDEYGNVETRAWFFGETPELEVEAESTVETIRVNPFDFLIDGAWMDLSWDNRLLAARPALAPYLRRERGRALLELSEKLKVEAGGQVLPFLLRLNRFLNENITYEIRPEGDPRSAEETLSLGRGACRDLTVLFMALARSQGIPARYVSGYHEGDPLKPNKELHAWAEVFLPGGGWRGFDPSVGLAVADHHIALAAGPDPPDAAALSGVFTSAKPGSKMETEVVFINDPS